MTTTTPPQQQQQDQPPAPQKPVRPPIDRQTVDRRIAPRGADTMNQQSSLDGDD